MDHLREAEVVVTQSGRAPLWDNLDFVETVVSRRPLGLLVDVDGTLSEIAPTAREAVVAPAASRLLESLCGNLAVVAAVSGRAAADAEQMVGVGGMLYFGNHGLERRQGGRTRTLLPNVRRARWEVRELFDGLTRELATLPGLVVEDKGLSVALHYRESPDPDAAAATALREARRWAAPRGMAVREGRMVVEVRFPAASKGAVVRRLVRAHHLAGAVYLGDDETDLDAFGALRRLRRPGGFAGLPVAVGSRESPPGLLEGADLWVDGVRGVVRFLEWLDARLTCVARPGLPAGGGASR